MLNTKSTKMVLDTVRGFMHLCGALAKHPGSCFRPWHFPPKDGETIISHPSSIFTLQHSSLTSTTVCRAHRCCEQRNATFLIYIVFSLQPYRVHARADDAVTRLRTQPPSSPEVEANQSPHDRHCICPIHSSHR